MLSAGLAALMSCIFARFQGGDFSVLSKIVLVRENRNKKEADEFQKWDSFLIEKTAGN